MASVNNFGGMAQWIGKIFLTIEKCGKRWSNRVWKIAPVLYIVADTDTHNDLQKSE